MKIFLHEIKELDTDLEFTQEESWVAEAVSSCDERFGIERPLPGLRTRPIQARLNVRKVDEVVVINGELSTYLQLVCSRCANPYSFECAPRFSTLYCKDPEMAGVGHLVGSTPKGQIHGKARHAHDESLDSEEGFGKDLDITYIAEDFINLADLVSEQLRLRLPFQPLCKEDCLGICTQCGADQNVGRCACSKILKENPFSALRKLKI